MARGHVHKLGCLHIFPQWRNQIETHHRFPSMMHFYVLRSLALAPLEWLHCRHKACPSEGPGLVIFKAKDKRMQSFPRKRSTSSIVNYCEENSTLKSYKWVIEPLTAKFNYRQNALYVMEKRSLIFCLLSLHTGTNGWYPNMIWWLSTLAFFASKK